MNLLYNKIIFLINIIIILMIFIIILIILLVIIYLINNINEKFISCNKIPSGPYKTKCTNIKFNNNILYALCPKLDHDNISEIITLDLADCVKDSNDCNSININSQGELVCE